MSGQPWVILRRKDASIVCDQLTGQPLTWTTKQRAEEYLAAASWALAQDDAYVTRTQRCQWKPKEKP